MVKAGFIIGHVRSRINGQSRFYHRACQEQNQWSKQVITIQKGPKSKVYHQSVCQESSQVKCPKVLSPD